MPHWAKAKLPFFILCGAVLWMPSAHADSLDPYGYDIIDTVGPASVTGTITTDGTFSSLSQADILAWDITINDGINSVTLTQSNSHLVFAGTDLSATPTELDFNFSADDGSHVDFVSNDFPAASFFDVFTDIGGSGLSWQAGPGDSLITENLTRPGSVASTPLPATLPLFATGLVALGLFGCRSKRKGAAAVTTAA